MKYKRTVLFFILSVALIALDQLSKNLIVRNIALYSKKVFIENFFSFYYVRNTGSAFSFLADRGWGIYVLTGISIVMAIIIAYLLIRSSFKNFIFLSISLTFLLAGAIGNLIDRVRLKYVVDFIRFDFGTYTFPIFNVADICAVAGTFLLIICIIFKQDQIDMIFPGKTLEAGK